MTLGRGDDTFDVSYRKPPTVSDGGSVAIAYLPRRAYSMADTYSNIRGRVRAG